MFGWVCYLFHPITKPNNNIYTHTERALVNMNEEYTLVVVVVFMWGRELLCMYVCIDIN